MPYNAKDHKHICTQTACPYKCQVQCWDKGLGIAVDCGRDCNCNEHAHHLDDEKKTSKDERHICAHEHRMWIKFIILYLVFHWLINRILK